MSEERTTTVTTIIIKLMTGGNGIFENTETTATTVGQLREQQGLDGTVVVNDVIATDDKPLSEGDRVSHVSGNKRGGQTR